MKEPLAQSTVAVRYGFNHKIKTECAYQNKAIPVFLGSTAALCVLSLLYLDVDWIKLAGRVPDMGSIFYRLAQFDFKYMDLIAAAMWETLSITVLSTLYSVILGLFFGMFAAENIFRMRWLLYRCCLLGLRYTTTRIYFVAPNRCHTFEFSVLIRPRTPL